MAVTGFSNTTGSQGRHSKQDVPGCPGARRVLIWKGQGLLWHLQVAADSLSHCLQMLGIQLTGKATVMGCV